MLLLLVRLHANFKSVCMLFFDGFKSVSCGVDTTGVEAVEPRDKVVVGVTVTSKQVLKSVYTPRYLEHKTRNNLDAENPKKKMQIGT